MPLQIEWYDQAERIMQCTIVGDWDIKSFNATYRQMFEMAREVNDKIGLICDVRQAGSFGVSDVSLLPISPFVGHAALVSKDINHPTLDVVDTILQAAAPDILISHATTIAIAADQVRAALPAVATNT